LYAAGIGTRFENKRKNIDLHDSYLSFHNARMKRLKVVYFKAAKGAGDEI